MTLRGGEAVVDEPLPPRRRRLTRVRALPPIGTTRLYLDVPYPCVLPGEQATADCDPDTARIIPNSWIVEPKPGAGAACRRWLWWGIGRWVWALRTPVRDTRSAA